jgi:hypothetical protein
MYIIDDIDQPDFLILQDTDRFHCILHSGEIVLSDATLIMVIFVVRRAASGLYDMFITHKFIRRDESTNKTFMSKKDIPAAEIEKVITNTATTFAGTLKIQGRVDVKWDELDLRNVAGRETKVERIKKWGKLKNVAVRE